MNKNTQFNNLYSVIFILKIAMNRQYISLYVIIIVLYLYTMIDKIKINVDYDAYYGIINEIEFFSFFEEGINKNSFLNNVIFGIYNFSKKRNVDVAKEIKKSTPILELKDEDFSFLVQYIDEIYYDYIFNTKREYYFMVYPGKQFQDFYTKLQLDEIKNKFSLSKYLSACLSKYLNFSRATRQIIYKYKEYLTINDAINKEEKIFLFDGVKERKISPIEIDVDSYKQNSYLKGYDEEEKKIYVFEFYKIMNVFKLNEKINISKQIYNSIDNITDKDLYYYNLDTIEVNTYFSSKANKISRYLLIDTPRIIKKKGNNITFNDEEEKIINYLKLFGDTVKIKEEHIVKKLKEFYHNSYLFFDNIDEK